MSLGSLLHTRSHINRGFVATVFYWECSSVGRAVVFKTYYRDIGSKPIISTTFMPMKVKPNLFPDVARRGFFFYLFCPKLSPFPVY